MPTNTALPGANWEGQQEEDIFMTGIKVITVTLKLDTSVVENQLRQIASELMSMADRIAETDIQEEE